MSKTRLFLCTLLGMGTLMLAAPATASASLSTNVKMHGIHMHSVQTGTRMHWIHMHGLKTNHHMNGIHMRDLKTNHHMDGVKTSPEWIRMHGLKAQPEWVKWHGIKMRGVKTSLPDIWIKWR